MAIFNNIEQVVLSNKKYNIILADPPWSYKVWSNKGAGRSAESHYHTMDAQSIRNMPVKDIVDKNAVLLMWVTYPCLEEGLELIKAWGFKYKTCAFSWVKTNKKNNTPFVGMGYYTRANNEICILATKGKPLQRQSKAVRQVILSPIREHSRKPDEVRDRIIDLFGDLPRIELFCRHPEQGWDSMGDELNG